MNNKSFQTFGLFVKSEIPKALSLAQKTAEYLLSNNYKVFVTKEAKEITSSLKSLSLCTKEEMPGQVDIVLVFGGDGTFLKMARQMTTHSVPILGINLGRLGFLAEVSEENILSALESICAGNFTLQERSLLEASVIRNSKVEISLLVVNDAVITNAHMARALDLDIHIDGVNVARIEADGVILSTPTGSTAYSLSAGGPIVHPKVSASIISPICPHGLTMRPIVVPDSMNVELRSLKKDGISILTLDGQFGYDLQPKDVVKVRKFQKHPLFIVSSGRQDYFMLLRKKFKLGQRGEEQISC